MKKILAISTIRSDYDVMSSLYKILEKAGDTELKLLVGGAHLSTTYGHTIDLIKKDGFSILLPVETLIDSSSSMSRLKTASIFLQNSIDIVAQYNPDVIIYAGDREDVIVGALLGSYLQIPTIHFYGGDHTEDGHVDNPVRHAVSKLSSLHFVVMEEHKKRLLKMGEHEKRIFVTGSLALDRFLKHKPISVAEIKKTFSIKKGFDKFALVIFHPLDSCMKDSFTHFENILMTLKKNHINAFVSFPNTDPGNREIIKIMDKYKSDDQFVFYRNLDRNMFLSIYKQCIVQLGNSSSGVTESASIPVPVVNVGNRQKGRHINSNVIFCDPSVSSIHKALLQVLSEEFRKKIQNISNIYGDGHSAERAYQLIRELDFKTFLYKTEDPLIVN